MNISKGEKKLKKLLVKMKPVLNEGEFVFTSLSDTSSIPREIIVCEIKEKEGITLVLSKQDAVKHGLAYGLVFAWITLTVHSSLEAVGLTAAFSSALAKEKISCNVIAGYFHDHIFVNSKDKERALRVLRKLSEISEN